MVWAHSGAPRSHGDWVGDLFGEAKFQEVVQPPTAFRNLGGPKTGGKALAGGVACAMRERRRQWPKVYADSIAAWGASEIKFINLIEGGALRGWNGPAEDRSGRRSG